MSTPSAISSAQRAAARQHLERACAALGLPADAQFVADLAVALPEAYTVARARWGLFTLRWMDGKVRERCPAPVYRAEDTG